jgi:membrane protease YdiL (CAAX protease family)
MSTGSPKSDLLMLTFFIMFLQIGLLAFVITLFVIHRKRTREFYKTGLVFGAVCFAFSLPITLFTLFGMDYAGMVPPGSGLGPGFAEMMKYIVMVVSVVAGIGGIGYVMFTYVIAAGEWDILRPRPFPVIMRTGEKSWGKIGIAALVGAAGAVVSLLSAKLLNVGAGDLIKIQENLLGDFRALPASLQFALMLMFVVSAAVSEELLYRGALLGFLFRVSKNRMAWLLGSIFSVSLVWAFMHVLNTDNPVFKLAQVFILGVVLAEVARRWSLEAAIATHVSLNVTAVVLGYLNIF